MNERNANQSDVDETDDLDEAVVAADDTGMLSEQREIQEAQILQHLGVDPAGGAGS